MVHQYFFWLTPTYEPASGVKWSGYYKDTPINDERLKEIKALEEVLTSLNSILVLYLAAKFDFMEFQSILMKRRDRIFRPSSKINAFYREDLKARILQKLQATLSSLHVFRDLSLAELRETKDGEIPARLISEQASFHFDNWLSYGFCYNLRNHALHHGSPIYIMHFRPEVQNGNEYMKITIPKSVIYNNKRLNSGIRERLLRDYPGEIVDIYPLVQDYYFVHTDFFMKICEHYEDQIEQARRLLRSLGRGAKRKGVLAIGTDAQKSGPISDARPLSLNCARQLAQEYRRAIRLFERLEVTHPSSTPR